MTDIQETTASPQHIAARRAARTLARFAKIKLEQLPIERADDIEKVMALAAKQRVHKQHRESMDGWRRSSLLTASIGGAMELTGAAAQATMTDQSSLWHFGAALLHPLMIVPTLFVAAVGVISHARHEVCQLSIAGVNRRTRRLAASHAAQQARL